MAFGINSNRGEGEGKPEQTSGGGWDTAEPSHARSGTSPSSYLPAFCERFRTHGTAPVSAGASCLQGKSSMGAPRPENGHRDRFGEHRDLIPQAGPSRSAREKNQRKKIKKRGFPGRNDSILLLQPPFSLVVGISQTGNKSKSHQEPLLPAVLPDGSPPCPAHELGDSSQPTP